MLTIKGIAFILFIILVFAICVKFAEKYSRKLNLRWRKLLLEFFVISFIFYISILAFGLFGVEFTKLENTWLLEILILLVIPALYAVITRLMVPLTGYHLLLLYCLIFNRLYKIMILANILYCLIPKIF